MAEYLQPFGNKLTVPEKQNYFSIRNRMENIPSISKGETAYFCICGEIENMGHIYNCKILSEGETKTKKLEYEKIFDGTMNQQVEVFRIIKQTWRKDN